MDDITLSPKPDFLTLTAEIVTAYISNNSMPCAELPTLIASVNTALGGLGGAAMTETSTIEKPTPAQIRKSITPEVLISFEDGKPYKTMRRHLTLRGLTPETYRAKWGLPADYPMTSKAYSAQRSALAKSLGLGQVRREPSNEVPVQSDATAPKRRGRPPGATKAATKA